MTAKDLRIGNMITYKSAADTNELMEVSVGCLYRIEENPDGYDPIQTTGDELTKLGFKVSEENDDWMVKENLTMTKDGRSVCFGYEHHWKNIGMMCKYVHKVQNLYFAITEEELDYKN